jgi:hypothetical protein
MKVYVKRPAKDRCPKCRAAEGSEYATILCGAYHTSNSCPMRSPPENRSGVFICETELTCGELLRWRDNLLEPEPDHGEATLLWQARYVLRDLHKKHPECGYGKMADACDRAADRAMTP